MIDIRGRRGRGSSFPASDSRAGRVLAMLIGVLYGDCLGAQYEFSRGPITGLLTIGPSVFGHPAGRGTDDTETTTAVAAGLARAARNGTTAACRAVAEEMSDWYQSGPPDVGGTTGSGLRHYQLTGELTEGSREETSIANGALMRSAPFAALNDADASQIAAESAKLTHAHPAVTAGVGCYVDLLRLLLVGETVRPGLNLHVNPEAKAKQPASLDQLEGPAGGYAPYALSLALWSATVADDFTSGLEAVVRLGGDTDTNGAICGAVLGARFGVPAEVYEQLAPDRVQQLRRLAAVLTEK